MAGVKSFLKTIAPEPEVLTAIRAGSKKNRTDKLSMRVINREISAYRKERALKDAREFVSEIFDELRR